MFKKTYFFAMMSMIMMLVACGGGSGSGSSSDSPSNDPQVAVSFDIAGSERLIVAKSDDVVEVSSAVTMASGESHGRGHNHLYKVDDHGNVNQATDLDVKHVHHHGHHTYVALNDSVNDSYLYEVNDQTNEYEKIDNCPLIERRKGHNDPIQWDGDNMFYGIHDPSDGKYKIRKRSNGQIRTVGSLSSTEELGDMFVNNGGVYFVAKGDGHHHLRHCDGDGNETEVSTAKSFGWLKRYPQEPGNTEKIHTCAQTDADYDILTIDTTGNQVSDSYPLGTSDWYGNEEASALLESKGFVTTNGTFLMFSATSNKIYQLYPEVTRAFLYECKAVTTDGEKLWVLMEDDSAAWVDPLTFSCYGGSAYDPAYADLYSQFQTIAQAHGYLYFTSVTDDGIFIGMQDSETNEVTGSTLTGVSEVTQDVIID